MILAKEPILSVFLFVSIRTPSLFKVVIKYFRFNFLNICLEIAANPREESDIYFLASISVGVIKSIFLNLEISPFCDEV